MAFEKKMTNMPPFTCFTQFHMNVALFEVNEKVGIIFLNSSCCHLVTKQLILITNKLSIDSFMLLVQLNS